MYKNTQLCEECGTTLMETQTHLVCPNCGLIQGQLFTQGTFTSIETSNSYGNQYVDVINKKSLANGGSGSFIDFFGSWQLNDFTGKRINQNDKFRFARLKKINDYYSQNSGHMKLYRALTLMNRIVGDLELPNSLKEESARIFRLSHEKINTSYKIPILVTSCIYLSSRIMNYNLLLKEILNACEKLNIKVKGKNLISAASDIKSVLKLQVRATRPEEYLEKAINLISNNNVIKNILKKNHIGFYEYSVKLRQITISILNFLPNDKRGGRNPFILATACVAGADTLISKSLGKKRGIATQKIIANACDIQEYTLREHYIKIIKPILSKIEI